MINFCQLRTILMLVFVYMGMFGCGGGSSQGSLLNANPPTVPNTPPNLTPVDPAPNNPLLPAGGQRIISDKPIDNFTLYRGNNNGPVGDAKAVVVEHPNFNSAIEITIDKPSGEFFNGSVSFPITQALTQGDVALLHVSFNMVSSADETGTGFVTAYVESPAPLYTKYLFYQLSSSGGWVDYYLPMIITDSFNANEILLTFGFGGGSKQQVVQIANIGLVNYKNTLNIEDLPQTQPSYLGRDPDAAWRAEANARIETHRKGNFSLTIVNSQGGILPNAEIRVNFTKHAYHFGSVAAARHLVGNDIDSQTYREKLLENFNQTGLENNLKWNAWVGDFGDAFSQEIALTASQWIKDNRLYSRGHVLVWPSPRNMPNYVQAYMPVDAPQNADPQVLIELEQHITDISVKTQGLLDEWDVLNEPFDNDYLMDAFGNNVMVDWFNQAAQQNPNVALYINDYSILSGGGTNTTHQDHYFNTIDFLLANNAPVTGIGMQSHFSTTPTPITRIYSIIERFHNAFPRLAIRSTEFDIDTFDEQMQADFTRDFLTIFFSHPATVGIQKWGFWEGAHWRPNAAMFRQNWEAKPNQLAWQETVYSVFWNDFIGMTDAQGQFSQRGFYGEYEVLVETDGVVQRFDINLLPNGTSQFTLQLN